MSPNTPTPQPLGMSGEEKKVDNITIDTLHVIADALGEENWWQKEPFQSGSDCEFHHECEDCDGLYGEYNIPAILKEHRRLVLEEVREIIEKKYEKEARLNKHCGDKPKRELCKDCTWGVNVMAEYHDIL